MKKIKNIHHLKEEKLRLFKEQKKLETQLRTQLSDLKVLTTPGNLLKDTIGTAIANTVEDKGASLKKGLLYYGAGLVARKLLGKMIGRFFIKS